MFKYTKKFDNYNPDEKKILDNALITCQKNNVIIPKLFFTRSEKIKKSYEKFLYPKRSCSDGKPRLLTTPIENCKLFFSYSTYLKLKN